MWVCKTEYFMRINHLLSFKQTTQANFNLAISYLYSSKHIISIQYM